MFQKPLVILIALSLTITSFAQKSSASNTRKLLTANEWELKYYLTNGTRSEIPESLKGLRLVFMPTKGLIYEYFPSQTEPVYIRKGLIEEEHFKYVDRIEEAEMEIDIDKLTKDGILVFYDEFDNNYTQSVYEKAGPIKDKGYPSQKYEVEDLDVPMQRIHPELETLVKSIAADLKKAGGNLLFHDKNKTKYLIKDVKFEATEYGVQFTLVFDSKDSKDISYAYEFMPEHIDDIVDVKVDPDSRVGQIRITMDDENALYKRISSRVAPSFLKSFSMEYFKESSSSFSRLQEKFEELSDAYIMGRTNRLEFLSQHIKTGRKIWLSQDGKSNNYQLSAMDLVGNKIYLYYNLETVGLTSNKKGSYLTIIPLADITSLSVENTKSNPKTLLMHSKKKGFETYTYSDSKYIPGERVFVMPLFNYAEIASKQERIEKTLKQLIMDDGGESVKVTYND